MINIQMFNKYMNLFSDLSDKNPSDLVLEMIWAVLKPYTDEQAEQALQEFAQSERLLKFPTPGEINQFISRRQEEQKSLEGAEQWGKLLPVICGNTNFNDAGLSVRTKQAILDIGGWGCFSQVLEKDVKWLKRDFLNAFLEAEKTKPKQLEGEAENKVKMSQVKALGEGATKIMPGLKD